jgi:hypothetical protein
MIRSRNDEHIDAAERLLWQLSSAGVIRERAHGCVIRYLDALAEPSPQAWSRFYRFVAVQLYDAAVSRPQLPPAALAVLRLIDDDFGRTVVDPPIRERILQALVESDVREASLPS